ncbi:RNA polymerase sigma factor [Ornithinimicrobium cavernae]|uniref:RNA polymerase sigma factor n=1 Tax=Ornithinimicrobium cavernae TaxID=2666047 RepID=UPI000D69AF36|nr:sigma-70 family RNA polymerase sigma factor [Ornithinimicrobium cavernae]
MPRVPRADRAADAALLAGLAVADPQAGSAFVARFQGAVFGMALSITRDPGLAEDVSQEAFVKAWRAAGSYDIRRASVLTWLLTITRNTAIDAVRSRRPVPADAEFLDQLVEDTLGSPDLAETTAHRLETERAVRRLHDLSPDQARAVVLAVVGGCTAREVSERERIPLGTAKTRIRDGLQRLRAAYATPESEGVDRG